MEEVEAIEGLPRMLRLVSSVESDRKKQRDMRGHRRHACGSHNQPSFDVRTNLIRFIAAETSLVMEVGEALTQQQRRHHHHHHHQDIANELKADKTCLMRRRRAFNKYNTDTPAAASRIATHPGAYVVWMGYKMSHPVRLISLCPSSRRQVRLASCRGLRNAPATHQKVETF